MEFIKKITDSIREKPSKISEDKEMHDIIINPDVTKEDAPVVSKQEKLDMELEKPAETPDLVPVNEQVQRIIFDAQHLAGSTDYSFEAHQRKLATSKNPKIIALSKLDQDDFNAAYAPYSNIAEAYSTVESLKVAGITTYLVNWAIESMPYGPVIAVENRGYKYLVCGADQYVNALNGFNHKPFAVFDWKGFNPRDFRQCTGWVIFNHNTVGFLSNGHITKIKGTLSFTLGGFSLNFLFVGKSQTVEFPFMFKDRQFMHFTNSDANNFYYDFETSESQLRLRYTQSNLTAHQCCTVVKRDQPNHVLYTARNFSYDLLMKYMENMKLCNDVEAFALLTTNVIPRKMKEEVEIEAGDVLSMIGDDLKSGFSGTFHSIGLVFASAIGLVTGRTWFGFINLLGTVVASCFSFVAFMYSLLFWTFGGVFYFIAWKFVNWNTKRTFGNFLKTLKERTFFPVICVVIPLIIILWIFKKKWSFAKKGDEEHMFGSCGVTHDELHIGPVKINGKVFAAKDITSLLGNLLSLLENTFSLLGFDTKSFGVILDRRVISSLFNTSGILGTLGDSSSPLKYFVDEEHSGDSLVDEVKSHISTLKTKASTVKVKEFLAMVEKEKYSIAGALLVTGALVAYIVWRVKGTKKCKNLTAFEEHLQLLCGTEDCTKDVIVNTVLANPSGAAQLFIPSGILEPIKILTNENHMKQRYRNRDKRTAMYEAVEDAKIYKSAREKKKEYKDKYGDMTFDEYNENERIKIMSERNSEYISQLATQIKNSKPPTVVFDGEDFGRYATVAQLVIGNKSQGYKVVTDKADKKGQTPLKDSASPVRRTLMTQWVGKPSKDQGVKAYYRYWKPNEGVYSPFVEIVAKATKEKHLSLPQAYDSTFSVNTPYGDAKAVCYDAKIYTNYHVVKRPNTIINLTSFSGKTAMELNTSSFAKVGDSDLAFAIVPDKHQKPPSFKLARAGCAQAATLLTTRNDKPAVFNTLVTHVGVLMKYADIVHRCPDAAKGDSGAPIIDTEGRLIGIHGGRIGNSEFGQMVFPLNEAYDEDFEEERHKEKMILYEAIKAIPHIKEREVVNIGNVEIFKYPGDIMKFDLQPFKEHEAYKINYPESNHVKIGSIPKRKLITREPKLFVDQVCSAIAKDFGLQPSEAYSITTNDLMSVYKDSSKYNRDIHWNPNEESVSFASDKLLKTFSILLSDDHYTFDEAVLVLKRKKSPGAAWPESTKGEVLDKYLPWIRDQVEFFFKTGHIPTPVVGMAFKEELRPYAKVIEHKVRTMCPMDIVLVIIEIMLYGKTIERLSSLPFNFSHCFVGYNFWFGGYVSFYNDMTQCVETRVRDQGKFDAHYCHPMRDIMTAFWQRMYINPMTQELVRCFETAMSNPLYILPDGNLIQFKNGGEQSGRYWTLTNNCLRNIWSIYYSLHRAGWTEAEIDKYVRFYVMGDDDIIGRLPGAPRRLPTGSEWMKYSYEINLDMDPVADEPDDFKNVLFCGLKYVKHVDGVPVFQPDLDKTLASLVVAKKRMTPSDHLSKILSLYQNTMYSYYGPRIKEFLYAFFKLPTICGDADAQALWIKADVPNTYRYYFPVEHIGARLNDTANKSTHTYEEMNFKLHGKYCGPGWSDGKWQNSVKKGVNAPEDELDAACQEHDSKYATPGADLEEADDKLYSRAWNNGSYHVALPMKVQSLLRKYGILSKYVSDDLSTQIDENTPNMPKNDKKIIKRAIKKVKRVEKKVAEKAAEVRVRTAPKRNRRKTRANRRQNIVSAAPSQTELRPSMKRIVKGDVTYVHFIYPLGSMSMTTVDRTVYNVIPISPLMMGSSIARAEAFVHDNYDVKASLVYKSQCNSTTGGSIFMSADMNPVDSLQVGTTIDADSFMNNEWFKEVPSFQMKPVSTKPITKNGLYTSATNNLPGQASKFQDPKLSSAATFTYGTWAAATTGAPRAGEFYVSGSFRFYNRSSEGIFPYFESYTYGVGTSQSAFATNFPLGWTEPTSGNYAIGSLANTDKRLGVAYGANYSVEINQPGCYYVTMIVTSDTGTFSTLPTIVPAGLGVVTYDAFKGSNSSNKHGCDARFIRKTSGINDTMSLSATFTVSASSNLNSRWYIAPVPDYSFSLLKPPKRIADIEELPQGNPSAMKLAVDYIFKNNLFDDYMLEKSKTKVDPISYLSEKGIHPGKAET